MSTSYSKLASPPSSSPDDWQIVFQARPSDDCLCPLCNSLSLQPHTTTCDCHAHCCLSCLITRQQQGLPPCSRAEHVNAVWLPDGGIKRKVDALEVKCPLRDSGCKWIGPLGQMPQHVNEGRQWGECKFAPLPCPLGCGGGSGTVRRGELNKHVANKCPMRSHECPHCLEQGTYLDITTDHTHHCPNRPIKCPNGCGIRRLQRRETDEHISLECPLATVCCEYEYLGCKVQPLRKHYQRHLKQFSQTHSLLVATENKQSCELIGHFHGN